MPNTSTGTAAQRDAYAYLKDVLDTYGLGNLADWAWQQIVAGHSDTEVLQSLRETPEFKARFPAIADREAKGLPTISPAEYIAYENQATQLLRAAGLPRGFYDAPDDFRRLIANDVSASELADRINQGYVKVANAPSAVRRAFQEYFGPSGDAALASYFLDPSRAQPVLETQLAAAEFGGTGFTFGFHIGEDVAMGAGRAGISQSQARSGFANLSAIAPLFDETVTEHTDITPDKEGVAATFGLSGATGAQKQITQRQNERKAAFSGGGGADEEHP